LKCIYGDFRPDLLSDSEREALLQHGAGLFKAKEAASEELPATMTRARFEKLSPIQRVEFMKTRQPILD
jgi:hypothetical protein